MAKRRTKREDDGDGPQNPAELRAMLEEFLGRVGRLNLAGMTEEEAQAFIEAQLAEGKLEHLAPQTPLEEAQELIYEAWEETGKRRQELARRALEISADCADAYAILAEEAELPSQALELYQKGVEAGERAIGPERFKEYEGNFWSVVETRPYMRARAELAAFYWDEGDPATAAEHYAEMLRLNPSDNQGLRYRYVHALLELDRDKEASALLKRYKDDPTSGWAYNRALLAFRQGGASHRANRELAHALDANPFVPLYLLGLVALPEEFPPYVGLGDDTEAIDYASDAYGNWAGTSGSLAWLASQWGPKLHAIIQRVRDQEIDTLAGILFEGEEEAEETEHDEDAQPDDAGAPPSGS